MGAERKIQIVSGLILIGIVALAVIITEICQRL